MARINIQVPYNDKHLVKARGAQWDSAARTWFVPDALDPYIFWEWLPQELKYTLLSDGYFIVTVQKQCWKCFESTSVHGVLLTDGYLELEELMAEDIGYGPDGNWTEERYLADLEAQMPIQWLRSDVPRMAYYLTEVAPHVAETLSFGAPHYRKDFSRTKQSAYWMNHCEHCDAKQGDFDLYEIAGGAFDPRPSDESTVRFHRVEGPFEAAGVTNRYSETLHMALRSHLHGPVALLRSSAPTGLWQRFVKIFR